MNTTEQPSIPGIKVLSGRDAGTCAIYEFAFVAGQEHLGLNEMIKTLKPGHQVCVPGIDAFESYLEVRRSVAGIEIRTSHHGSCGTWASASFQEAHEFLYPASAILNGTSQQYTGTYTLYPNKKDD
jgi:hypothetical protein